MDHQPWPCRWILLITWYTPDTLKRLFFFSSYNMWRWEIQIQILPMERTSQCHWATTIGSKKCLFFFFWQTNQYTLCIWTMYVLKTKGRKNQIRLVEPITNADPFTIISKFLKIKSKSYIMVKWVKIFFFFPQFLLAIIKTSNSYY